MNIHSALQIVSGSDVIVDYGDGKPFDFVAEERL
jgi:hypothetical protein